MQKDKQINIQIGRQLDSKESWIGLDRLKQFDTDSQIDKQLESQIVIQTEIDKLTCRQIKIN